MTLRAEPNSIRSHGRDLDFHMLGPVEAVDRDGAALSLGTPRARALLAALLIHPGTALSVDRLIELLWDGDAPATARTMVHGAVAVLRRGLAGPASGAGRLITRAGGYVLDVRPEQIDAARFEELLAEGRRLAQRAPARASERFADGLRLWRGPALADIDVEFARAAAGRWEELRLECVEGRLTAELALGHHREVIVELEKLVGQHPFREQLHALLVLALYRSDRQADALAALRAVRHNLGEEIGVSPGPTLRALEQAVLRHNPDLDLDASVSGSPVRVGRSLPATFSTFIGRLRERPEIAELVSANRLVTLTGPGGAGKSRLALELARTLGQRGSVEIFFADLAPLSTPELVGEAVAEAVGVRPAPGATLAEALCSALAGRRVLLLLDNCEHLVDACASALTPLLSAVSDLHLLLTSRVPLGVSGEHVYPVGPLPMAAAEASWEQIAACDAVQLFVHRVAAARRGFTVTDENARAVLAICRTLDGLPLALELVAARAASMPVPDLARRLTASFQLLDLGGRRVGDVRHRSLSAAIAWSYNLLPDAQRRLLARISVFPAAFTLAAAEDVTSGEGLSRQDVGILLAGLVGSSTVELAEDADGLARYRTLQTTRRYSRGLLDDAAFSTLRRRHAQHYLAQAEAARPHLFRSGSGAWLRRLDIEHDHFRAALEWALGTRGDPWLGVRLIGCLWHSWDLRGARREGLHWVHAGLRAVGAQAGEQRLSLLSAGALFHLGLAEFDDVAVLAGEQRSLARAVGDRAAEGDALALEATVAWARGAFDRARHLYEDGIVLSLDGGDIWGAALAEAQLARLHRDRDEPDAARSVVLRARRHADEVGEELARGLAVDVLASLEYRWGDTGAAGELVDAALRHYRAVGYLEGVASALHLRGRLALSSGNYRQARADFTRSLEMCRQIGLRGGSAAALEGLAAAAAAVSEDRCAIDLLGAAAALREEIGSPLTGAPGRDIARLRKQVAARLVGD